MAGFNQSKISIPFNTYTLSFNYKRGYIGVGTGETGQGDCWFIFRSNSIDSVNDTLVYAVEHSRNAPGALRLISAVFDGDKDTGTITSISVLAQSCSIPQMTFLSGATNMVTNPYSSIDIHYNNNWVNVEYNRTPVMTYYIGSSSRVGNYVGYSLYSVAAIDSYYSPELDTPVENITYNPGDTADVVLKSVCDLDYSDYTFSNSDYLKIRNVKSIADITANLNAQIMNLDLEETDMDVINRSIVVSDKYRAYVNDYSSLMNTSGSVTLNEPRVMVTSIESIDSVISCSITADNIVQTSKRYSKQLGVIVWGQPQVNLYDNVTISNSYYNLYGTFKVYNKEDVVDQKGNYYTTLGLGAI